MQPCELSKRGCADTLAEWRVRLWSPCLPLSILQIKSPSHPHAASVASLDKTSEEKKSNWRCVLLHYCKSLLLIVAVYDKLFVLNITVISRKKSIAYDMIIGRQDSS